MKQLVVIDCQNDFISGSLACINANEAVDYIVETIKQYPDLEVFYSLDWHSENNKSFERNGGIWPDHCVQNTYGAQLSNRFFELPLEQQPNSHNMFFKGEDDEIEEYSAIHAKNIYGEVLIDLIEPEAYIAGIASEYCVRETVFEALDQVKFKVIEEGLGYVAQDTHQQVLEEYQEIDALVKA